MSENKLNVSLLDLTMATINYNPEQHYQGSWRCGTGMCFAGWAAQLAGYRWATESPDAENSEYVIVPEGTDGAVLFDTKTNMVYESRMSVAESIATAARETGSYLESSWAQRDALRRLTDMAEVFAAMYSDPNRFVWARPVSDVAQKALGLNEEEANRLFSGGNSRWRLGKLVSQLKEAHVDQGLDQ